MKVKTCKQREILVEVSLDYLSDYCSECVAINFAVVTMYMFVFVFAMVMCCSKRLDLCACITGSACRQFCR